MKILFFVPLLLSFMSSYAAAFEVKINNFDGLNNRLLLKAQSADTQFLNAGDILYLNDNKRYLKVVFLRLPAPDQILLQCPAGNGCESLINSKVTLIQAEDLPASVNRSQDDQEVFRPAGASESYGRSMEEIKRYVQTEVDASTPTGKRIQDKYNSLARKEELGKAFSTPFYIAGFVGLVLFAIVVPDKGETDNRTDQQKEHALGLGLGSAASLLVGLGVQSSSQPSPQELDALIELIKGNSSPAKKVGMSWNLRPHFSFENREPSLGLTLNL